VLAAVMLGEGTGYLQVTGLGLVLLGSLSLVKFESRLEIATPSKSRPGS
jgi:hypothetical protein